MDTPQFPYVHGFSKEEQDRLLRQAHYTEHAIYQDVNFYEHRHILEIGSGIGAQTAILLRRFPNLKITCIEKNEKQIATAESYLAGQAYAAGRYEILRMDASALDLPLEPNTYDGAFVCWVLEHVAAPTKVLAEIRRVLPKNAPVYITEVMNSSLFLEPYSPHTWRFWMAFNDYQHDCAGDPFIGAKLGNLLQSLGFRDIRTTTKIEHCDNREPRKRQIAIRLLKELLLSTSDILQNAGRVDEVTIAGMKAELEAVESDPNAVYFYAFMQALAYT